MYYSILPVLQPEETVQYVELNYNGCDVLAVVTEEGYKMERLYSSDYTNFLDEKFMPGTLLDVRLINSTVPICS